MAGRSSEPLMVPEGELRPPPKRASTIAGCHATAFWPACKSEGRKAGWCPTCMGELSGMPVPCCHPFVARWVHDSAWTNHKVGR